MKATMIFNHYKNILDELLSESNFFKYYFQAPTSLEEDIYWEDWEEECHTLFDNSISIRFGATRGCFIDDTYDYVVKFDLDEAQENGSCSDEILIYDAAAQNGLEKFFAQPIYLGTYTKKIKFYTYSDLYDYFECPEFFDETFFCKKLQSMIEEYNMEKEEITISIPLYAYPRAERYNFGHHSDEEVSSFRATHSDVSPLLERSTSVGIAFVKEYGEEVFEKLSEFLLDHKVNDLHSGNVMSYQNHLILTDY